MSHPREAPPMLRGYVTAPYMCSYLPGERARARVVMPDQGNWSAQQYTLAVAQGFRRSGHHVYRPHCDACQACVPLRVPVAGFTPNRSQRRVWRALQGLVATQAPRVFTPEHFDLYRAYQRARHPGGGMDTADPAQYCDFLIDSPVQTQLIEFRQDGALRMVSVIDVLQDGWSAVYTFFDPTRTKGLGTYNVLWQIDQVRRLGLDHVYLGYWIAQDPKMAYKSHFRPHQCLRAGHWLDVVGAGG